MNTPHGGTVYIAVYTFVRNLRPAVG